MWSKDGAKLLGNVGERNYGELEESDIPGTADVVLVDKNELQIWDYKTGSWDYRNNVSFLGPPSDSAQLLFLALCARDVYGKRDKYVVGYQFLRPRGVVISDHQNIHDAQLDAFGERLLKGLAAARTAKDLIDEFKNPPVNAGDWCGFCPAKGCCPLLRIQDG